MACLGLLLTICATGAVGAAPDDPNIGIESPSQGSGVDTSTTNESNAPISESTSDRVTTESEKEIPSNFALNTYPSKFDDEDVSINDIVPTEDGNYILVGAVVENDRDGGDGIVAKVDSDGSIIWNHRYGNEDSQALWSGIETKSGEYVLSGWTETAESFSGWGIKISQDGDKQFEFELPEFPEGTYYDVEQTENGDYLFAGTYTSAEGDDNAIVTKTNSNGQYLWDFIYWDESEHNSQRFYGLEQYESDIYVLVGEAFQDESWDGWELWIDSDGEIIESNTDGHSILDDWLFDVAVTDDGDLVYVGSQNGNWDSENNRYTSLDGWVIYASSEEEWEETVSPDVVNRLSAVDTDGDRIVAAGHASSTDGVERSQLVSEFTMGGSKNWVSTLDEGVDQDFDGVVTNEDETFVAGQRQQNIADNFDGVLYKFAGESEEDEPPELGTIEGAISFDDSLLVEPVTNPVTVEVSATDSDSESSETITIDATTDTSPVAYTIGDLEPDTYSLEAEVVTVDDDPDRADEVAIEEESRNVTVPEDGTDDGHEFTLNKLDDDEPSINDYTDADGNADVDDLRDAIDDWRDEQIGTDLLREVIDAWRG